MVNAKFLQQIEDTARDLVSNPDHFRLEPRFEDAPPPYKDTVAAIVAIAESPYTGPDDRP